MTTMTVRSNIGPDGVLRLEVLSSLPPGPVEVVVVVHPAAPIEEESLCDQAATEQERPAHRARSGLFLNRGLSGVDVEAVTRNLESAWKTGLADLEP